jgi:hypothetical protein
MLPGSAKGPLQDPGPARDPPSSQAVSRDADLAFPSSDTGSGLQGLRVTREPERRGNFTHRWVFNTSWILRIRTGELWGAPAPFPWEILGSNSSCTSSCFASVTVIFGAWELSLPACTQARDLHSFVILGPQEDKECCACLILVDIKHKLLLTASTITQDTQTFRPRICVSLDCIYPILNTFIYKKKKLAIHVLEENSL